MTINLDFDGTCVTHAFPEVGKNIGAQRVLKKLKVLKKLYLLKRMLIKYLHFVTM